ncbi:D-isomer specific 2-hydroxyacid dehydrogenase NAD-binding protein [Reticulomyxa filosa]|uniref:D-isomer specific 2-hydroxyacid dehydrogenase NAD-binding protein n=1 Tax=Reticulomyxa filosa TaxID=46433 RepID=X6NZT5_RETFI|nr:D-isomer specific 2-hydroxyacid dehydrogenase NAD-binding protein [Reticulomyxa filosa]|eukprot:ETO31486.1 D-isomer specific 2-hydroxyacid dehydrogenase NAD-binding protein [Reticulomyxa filosa]
MILRLTWLTGISFHIFCREGKKKLLLFLQSQCCQDLQKAEAMPISGNTKHEALQKSCVPYILEVISVLLRFIVLFVIKKKTQNDKDGDQSEFMKNLVDAEVAISQPFWPAYLSGHRLNAAKNLKLAITAGVGSDHVDLESLPLLIIRHHFKKKIRVKYMYICMSNNHNNNNNNNNNNIQNYFKYR